MVIARDDKELISVIKYYENIYVSHDVKTLPDFNKKNCMVIVLWVRNNNMIQLPSFDGFSKLDR